VEINNPSPLKSTSWDKYPVLQTFIMEYPKVLEKRICITCGSMSTIEYHDFNEYLDCPEYRCSKCGQITNEFYLEDLP